MVRITRALALSSQSRLHHSQNAKTHYCYHYYPTRFVEDENSRCLRHVVVDAHKKDVFEGEDNPARVNRTRRVFARPTYKAYSACTLGCSGVANSSEGVGRGAIAVCLLIIYRENVVEKYPVNSGFISMGVGPILSVLFCDPKIHLTLGFGFTI